MEILKSWKARRAGGRITITHATGKVVGVDVIEPRDSGDNSGRTMVVAVDKDGQEYRLA